VEEVGRSIGEMLLANVAGLEERPRYIGALALTRLAAWLAVRRRQPL
jgi:hypothetical protein